jgi:hypothetical protein
LGAQTSGAAAGSASSEHPRSGAPFAGASGDLNLSALARLTGGAQTSGAQSLADIAGARTVGDAGNSALASAKLLADARERAHAARANHLMHIASSMDPVMAEALRGAAERTGALGEAGSGGAGGIAPNQEGGCSIS